MKILKSKNQSEWTLLGSDGKALGYVSTYRTRGQYGDSIYQSVTSSLIRGHFHNLEDAIGFIAFKMIGITRDQWNRLMEENQLKIN